jgi:hypothetical protein
LSWRTSARWEAGGRRWRRAGTWRCGCSRCSPSRTGPACWRCDGPGTHSLAADLRNDDGTVPLPATLTEVIEVAEHTDGVRLGDLITALEPDPQAAEDALTQILQP